MIRNHTAIEKAYEIIGNKTPLKGHDCGQLCSSACCDGGEDDGMLLFPNESTTLTIREASPGRLAVCNGSCERSERPFSCRIFPFFPAVDKRGRVRVILDPRAKRICPLAAYSENVIFDRSFIRAVGRAGKMLVKDEQCRRFMRELTLELETVERFF